MSSTRDCYSKGLLFEGTAIRGVLNMPADETFRAVEVIEKVHTLSLPLEQFR